MSNNKGIKNCKQIMGIDGLFLSFLIMFLLYLCLRQSNNTPETL